MSTACSTCSVVCWHVMLAKVHAGVHAHAHALPGQVTLEHSNQALHSCNSLADQHISEVRWLLTGCLVACIVPAAQDRVRCHSIALTLHTVADIHCCCLTGGALQPCSSSVAQS